MRSCPFCGLVDDHDDKCYFTLKLAGAMSGDLQRAWDRRAGTEKDAERMEYVLKHGMPLKGWDNDDREQYRYMHIQAWSSTAVEAVDAAIAANSKAGTEPA